jgi:hypothetical protein
MYAEHSVNVEPHSGRTTPFMPAARLPFVSIAALLGLLVGTGSVAAQTSPAPNCVQPSDQQLIVYHAGSLSGAFTPWSRRSPAVRG